MKKRFRYIFLMALLAAGGILVFQVYWVFNTYNAGKNTLNRTLANLLEKSIENYELGQNELPSSLKYNTPSLSVFMNATPDNNLPDSIRSALKNARAIYTVQYKNIRINAADLPIVKLLIARLVAQQLSAPIKMDALAGNFRSELNKAHIDLPFRLILYKDRASLPPGRITATLNFLRSPAIVEAVFNNTAGLLLARNLLPVLVSLLLILLSAGSLFYMGFIIRKQMQLDDLKTDFINNITHELQTPIAILKTTNEALTDFGAAEDPGRSARYLSINHAVLEKLSRNVGRILDMTQYEQGFKLASYEPVDLCALVEQTIHPFTVNEQVTMQLNCETAGRMVFTDHYILSTIISNLVDNAVKYSRGLAVINITVRLVSGGWQLIVADNGKGIEPAKLPFIYDKFFRIQDGNLHEVKGYGLGLSYVKQLVAELNGQIAVVSQLGTGTTFTLNFPDNGQG